MKILFQILLCFGISAQCLSQQVNPEGKIQIIADSRIDSLVEVHKKINLERNSIPGYRVQLYFGSDRTKANSIKSDFLNKFPDMGAYLIYQQPNYKVRVGDFRTRIEAYDVYKKVAADFPSAFIVKEDIKLPEIE